MSENLKRAESLFNRIMNPNKQQGSSEPGPQKYHKAASHNHHQSGDPELGRGNGRHSSNHSNAHRYSGRSSYKHPTALAVSTVDVPKRDPEQEAKAAVSALAENLHVLPYCWTIWHHSRSKTKVPAVADEGGSAAPDAAKAGAAAVDSYLQAATEIEFPCFGQPEKPVKPIASLEQMWMSLSALKKSHELVNGSELLVFKTGVNPVWEDPINSRGGRWVFRFSHRVNPNAASQESQEAIQRGRRRATLVWERLVLKTLTGCILLGRKEHHDALLSDIVGLVLSVRRDEEIISIWNSNSHVSKKSADDEDKKGSVAGFHARRVYCDAILRVIREVDAIMQGSDCVETQLSSSNERVNGVTFEYRLHSDNSHPYNPNERRRGKGYHHHHQKEEKDEDA
ncbi:translation initiation factor eIF4e [Metschnikowia bicuspidata var. bicuspidata NRRL YB-4993]|uniref:Translation initiation factor eIF4e n=1 Tax=Metschnikowia bicuspidata var. bicuspidata NRRL YB-4993 TaxID=869754 RepID=A0A1A0H5W9_9ASCO|nr:translation initiation factor eIF4e [Metschnikowia bicuspidata var. bicuspidata NRRL YB-4993]OBA19302.1 translation initiation factor eIF4e [Metschnikowia bicuspidata var. bicuspidata NRRL YB-4993]